MEPAVQAQKGNQSTMKHKARLEEAHTQTPYVRVITTLETQDMIDAIKHDDKLWDALGELFDGCSDATCLLTFKEAALYQLAKKLERQGVDLIGASCPNKKGKTLDGHGCGLVDRIRKAISSFGTHVGDPKSDMNTLAQLEYCYGVLRWESQAKKQEYLLYARLKWVEKVLGDSFDDPYYHERPTTEWIECARARAFAYNFDVMVERQWCKEHFLNLAYSIGRDQALYSSHHPTVK